jgi:hypothetical protein
MDKAQVIDAVLDVAPGVMLYLPDELFDAAKTEQGYFRQLWGRIKEFYRGEIAQGQFLDSLANLVQDQITRAWRQALRDEGLDPKQVDSVYQEPVEAMILAEFDHIDNLAADVAQARENERGFDGFRSRAEIWAKRYPDAVNRANLAIVEKNGGRLEWELGQTEEHCTTCAGLHGIVAFAREWREAGVQPQSPPNEQLECGGWHCDCKLKPTTRRRSRNALDRIQGIIQNGG